MKSKAVKLNKGRRRLSGLKIRAIKARLGATKKRKTTH